MRRLALLAVVLLAGCILPMPRTRYTAGMDRKKVVDKRDPDILVAFDGSVCSVSKDKYEKTSSGDVVFCVWRDARTGTGTQLRLR